MPIAAAAPGKLVLIGEYAVLDGTPALVMAVGRHVRATLARAEGARSRLSIVMAGNSQETVFGPGEGTGSPLVDAVIEAGPALDWPAWDGVLDSTAFFLGTTKLGLGSSAAALTAWAGAWWAAAAPDTPLPACEPLIAIHRGFQRGVGSGLDVAASRLGGVLEYRLDADFVPQIGSVRLPNSVGFAGIFAGTSASTTDFVGRYREWQLAQPADARDLRAEMHAIAVAGGVAAREGAGADFVAAMAAYGECLQRLGYSMQMDLVTREHMEIGRMARQFDVAYKVSGAGGGDLGIAASIDPERLTAFLSEVRRHGYHVVDLPLDEQGLVVEEQA